MKKPWFEKKQLGWGWGLPLTWQGWLTLALFVAAIIVINFTVRTTLPHILLVILAVIALCVVARITSGKPSWSNGENYVYDKRKLLKVLIVLLSIIIIFGVSEAIFLQRAHSSFENYYNFRGCAQLLQKTDTFATCQLPSGKVITLVEINNKWYLQGDGPGNW